MDTIGQIVRTRREALGLSQGKLAERAGVTKPWIYRVETGKTKNPGTRRLRALCVALGLDFATLTETGGADANNDVTTKTALQIGTSVLEIMHRVSIPAPVYRTNNPSEVLGTVYLPLEEETASMFKGHDLEYLRVMDGDCAPFALAGEVLLVVTDIDPDDGDTVAFEGGDGHLHTGTFHKHNATTPYVLVPNQNPQPVAEGAIRGPVVWKVQQIKTIKAK